MSGSEDSLWKMERDKLSSFGILKRIEHKHELGWPDVLYVLRRPAPFHDQRATGFIENKQLDGWPIRASSVVRIPSLTRDQANWLGAWSKAGGRAALGLQVGSEYLFFSGSVVGPIFLDNPLPQAAVRGYAGLIMSDGFRVADALKFLAG